ncbi:MAG: hypothetical protein WA874_04825 [Chryseosolibacter sp.]
MLRILFTVVQILVSVCLLQGQNVRGGFGHGYFGPVLNVFQNLQNDLRTPSSLGKKLETTRLETLGGGGGYGLFSNGVLLGGSGMGYTVTDATERGQVNLAMGAAYLNVGYLVTKKRNVLGFPYIGVGGYEMKLRVKNSAEGESFAVGDQDVPFDEYLYLHNQGMTFEAGYSLQILTFSLPDNGSKGGLIVGLQAGTYLFVSTEDWHNESTDDVLLSFSDPFGFAPYVRLTIGGGGFKAVSD